jgi:hypothetical protein
MNNQTQKPKTSPWIYILVGMVIALVYILYESTFSGNKCKIQYAQYVRVYAGSSINTDIVAMLAEGDIVTLPLGKTSDWHVWQQIATPEGVIGWVAENWEQICVKTLLP